MDMDLEFIRVAVPYLRMQLSQHRFKHVDKSECCVQLTSLIIKRIERLWRVQDDVQDARSAMVKQQAWALR